MANKNPYFSRLEKIAEKENKLQEFRDGYNSLPIDEGTDKPSTEQIKKLFADLELTFPTMGANRKKESIEEKANILIDILKNGTKKEKNDLEEIIKSHKAKADNKRQIELWAKEKKYLEKVIKENQRKVTDLDGKIKQLSEE